jgi:hypothetical protein
MYIPFDQMPDEARVWIYPSNRPFSESEIPLLKDLVEKFLTQWTAHNQALEASYDLPYNRFIILAVNQKNVQASGCSIDASVRFIQQLESQFGLVLLDKMNVTFKQGEFLAHKPLDEFVKMAKAKSVSGATVVFNNLVDNVADYKQFWEVPAQDSWHQRFIK